MTRHIAVPARRVKSRAVQHAPRRLPLTLALAAALSLGAAAPASASTTYTWTGNTNGDWGTANNWKHSNGFTDTTGVPIADANLRFGASSNLISYISNVPGGTIYTGGISFIAGAGAYDFKGSGAIGIVQSGISNLSGKLQVFNMRIDPYGDQTWDGGTGGIKGINFAGVDYAVTLTNKVTLVESGVITTVGRAGTGTLNLLAGSSLAAPSVYIGEEFGSNGTIKVDGNLSKLTAAATGDLQVGINSTGTLTVQNGGTVSSGNAVIGKNELGDGLATFSGGATSWVSTGNLAIGDGGFGSLRVEAGAKVGHVNGSLGNLANSAGAATITGANSAWTLSGNLQVGTLGQGTVNIAAGGRLSDLNATIGAMGAPADAGLNGVTVTGNGSSWANTGRLTIVNGQLSIEDGAAVTAADATFAQLAGSQAVVNLLGTGSSLTLTGILIIGGNATGTAVPVGSASVSLGAGTTLNSGTQLQVLKGGVLSLNGGTLNVGYSTNAGLVNLNTGTLNFVGSAATGNGILDHNVGLGIDMNVTTGFDLLVQAGDILSLNGGQVRTVGLTVRGDLVVGNLSTVTVGARGVDNFSSVQLAGGTINSAGLINNPGYWSGFGGVTGAGSFTNDGLLRQGDGTLAFSNTGTNSNNGTWEMQSGRSLVLTSGLTNNGAVKLNGGTVSGGTLVNSVAGTISGSGRISAGLDNRGSLVINEGLTLVDNAFVNRGQILLGSNLTTLGGGQVNNLGLIQGLGKINSNISNANALGVIEAQGGTLTLTGQFVGANVGILTANSGAKLLITQGLASNAGKIQLAGGTLDNNNLAMVNEAGGTISGFGTLRGGQLTNQGKVLLSGGSSTIYSDILAVNASQIILSGLSNNTFHGKLDVQSGAELRVSTGSVATFFGDVYQRTGAKFTGAGTKRFEGTYTPGASPGMGSDEGDVEFGESSRYLAEIGGITACTLACGTDDAFKNSSFDKYIVDGKLSLGGTLQLVSWNGFVGQAGQHFDLLDWGSLNGQFDTIDASGFRLAAGTKLDFSQLYTTGEVSVLAGIPAVPEPATYALWLAGLVGMGFVARRRRAVKA